MRPTYVLLILSLATACQEHVHSRQTLLKTPTTLRPDVYLGNDADSISLAERDKKYLYYLSKLKPINGYRFVVKGDFDGDGKKEVLTEHFCSGLDHKETNKFYDSLDYGDYQYIDYLKQINAFVNCSNKHIDTIRGTGGLGLLLLKNEGDLDGDGGDELTLVRDNADYSNCNHCELLSYKRHKWRVMYSFSIRDMQIPPLPKAATLYGLFGSYGVVFSPSDSIDRLLERQLKEFGFIKKLRNGKIWVAYIDNEANDRIKEIDVRKLKGRLYR